ncbi:YdcF family protein [Collinsella ihumii]|uniref:YdcF family protein n=1 Tax=Collinsella ihumii TaxID=1720204 RepID=A0ABT7XBE9_9ACTN|nr:YdcF family protein [Collinsella ihumii]MDN0062738.1 YdcF family protein [Collinsella ihumii]
MDVHLMGLVLAVVALAVLVVTFRMGTRAFGRASVPAALMLFTGLVIATCAAPDGFTVTSGSLMIVFVLVAVELFAMNGVLLISRDGGVRPASAIPLAIAVVLALLFTVVPMVVEGAGNQLVSALLGLISLVGLWMSFSLAMVALASFVYRVAARGAAPDRKNAYKFIVVHGAAIEGTRPSPVLMDRLDCAFTLWERQGKKGTIIVSGGQGSDEELSEARVMHDYLRDRGVPKKQLVEEDRSSTTRENLAFSREVMGGLTTAESYRVALVTSDFHAYRCGYLACRMGLDADVMGATTAGDTWARSIIREFGAVCADFPWTFAVPVVLWAAGLILL